MKLEKKWEFQLSKLENDEDDRRVTVENLFDFLRSHVMSEEATEKSSYQNKSKYNGFEKQREKLRKDEREKDPVKESPYSATALPSSAKTDKEETGRTVCGF